MPPRRSTAPALALAIAGVLILSPAPAAAATKRGVSTKVARKTLTITGSKKADKIVVRLRRRARNTLEVDVGGRSTAEFRFNRRSFSKIAVRGGRGNDAVTIDERGGVFTAAERTTVAGDAGSDRLIVIGSAGSDAITAGAARRRLSLLRGGRPQATATRVESLTINPLGGADAITVDDLTGSGVRTTALGLAGDGAADSVVVNGTTGNDALTVSGSGAGFSIAGLPAAVAATGADPGVDRLSLNGLAGSDTISAPTLSAAAVALTVDGGAGDDTVSGGDGADALSGGAGNDRFQWEPGDGADRVDGHDGVDRVAAGGTDGIDNFTVGPIDGGLRVSRDDATAEGVRIESVDLAPRGSADRIGLEGTGAGDAVGVSGTTGGVDVTGPAPVTIAQPEPGDLLTVAPGAGGDNVDASGLAADALSLTVAGGPGADLLTGGAGGDTFVSGAGDDSDTVNGGGGADRVAFTATDGPDALGIASDGGRLRVLLGGVARVDAGGVETAEVNALSGADEFTVDGTAADDAFTIGVGASNVSVLGQAATVDIARTDDGGDRLTVNGLDGADTVDASVAGGGIAFSAEGGAGSGDRLVLNGTDAADAFNFAANGARLRLARDVDNVVIDANDFEIARVNPLGGADRVAIADLAGTDVTQAVADLAGAVGGSTGDGQTDTVIRNATGGDDVMTTSGNGSGGINVTGPSAAVSVDHSDAADTLVLSLLGGEDVLNATALPAGRVALTIDGGLGDDVILGSPGDDFVDGGDGDDTALVGAGNDTFRWEPGDDNDTIEGQAGPADRLLFVGAAVAENFDFMANGGRVLFLRNIANVTMDMNDVEAVDLSALGGADNVTVGDLSGTDLTQARVDLAGPGGTAGDGQVDNVILNGTNASDSVTVGGTAASGVTATGLATSLSIQHAEPTVGDRLRVNTLGGNDGVGAANLAADAIRLTLDGGADSDVLTGGAGPDELIGGPGADQLFGGPGLDTFDFDPSDPIHDPGPS